MEIAERPTTKAYVRTETAETIRRAFQKRFVDAPGGSRPVLLELDVQQYSVDSNSGRLLTTTRFVDAKTGTLLLEGPQILENRQKQTSFYFTSVAGLVAGLLVVAEIEALQRQNEELLDLASSKLKTWLLKPAEQ